MFIETVADVIPHGRPIIRQCNRFEIINFPTLLNTANRYYKIEVSAILVTRLGYRLLGSSSYLRSPRESAGSLEANSRCYSFPVTTLADAPATTPIASV